MPKGKALSLVAMLFMLAGAAQIAAAQEEAPEPTEAPAAVEQPGTPAEPAAPAGAEAPKDTKGQGQPPGDKPPPKGPTMWPLLLIVGAFFLMYIWMGRGKRKEQHRRREMLSALKKGDKITTIGGVVGTVIEIRDDEVTVKVDESGNVRMKFARWAIRGVGDLAKAENPAQAAREQQRSQT